MDYSFKTDSIHKWEASATGAIRTITNFQISYIRRTLVANKIDHSDEAEELPVGAAPTASSFST